MAGKVISWVVAILAFLLLVTFIVLKVVGIIDWSWWWIILPAWLSIGTFSLAISGPEEDDLASVGILLLILAILFYKKH